MESEAQSKISRRFLPWDRPLLPQAVAHLTAGWNGEAALDLSSVLVLAPTRQAGRRLREALAAYAATRGHAVFPPQVMTLEALVSEALGAEDEASRLESQLAWARVLREADLAEFAAVFPVAPPAQDFAWAVRLAAEQARLQDTLAEAGLRLGDVPGRMGKDFSERERWEQLGELERQQAAALNQAGRRDTVSGRLARLDAVAAPAGVERVVMIATPDPRTVALAVLRRHAKRVPVEVLVFAPESEAAAFDEWGRPAPEHWAQRELLTELFDEHVHLCADPEAQAARAAALAKAYAGGEGVLALGVVDEDLLSPLDRALREHGLTGFNPEGRARRGDRLQQLLGALAALARDDDFAQVAALARQPDVLAALRRELGGSWSAAGFLSALDKLHSERLPADLAEAARHWRGGELEFFTGWRQALQRGAFPGNVAGVLREIFAGRRLSLAEPGEAALVAAAGVWTEVAQEVARAAGVFPELTGMVAWDTALRLYGEAREFPEKPAGAVELQGWLELLWEDAPHLVVAGFNDGRVPSAVNGDAFLPESVRERLGLKTNAMRFATDAYYLAALAASRAQGGRLDILLGRVSAAGEPLRPSRLLLRCADAELPRRVARLFRELPPAGPNLPWHRAWRLRPEKKAAPVRLAVTALRDWLDCPFRFYLRRVLRMEPVDAAKVEMDALDFGILCHAALDAMGKETALRDCKDEAVLREFLAAALERAAEGKFGRERSLPLIAQLESARQRLGALAAAQARARAEGWVIERTEWKFEIAVGSLTIAGKIDRIDRHERTGEVRVLDYKTSDTAVNPAEAHLRGVRKGETPRDWAQWVEEGKTRVWQDLQLPLYMKRAAAEFPGAAMSCGYFNLPKAVTETGIAEWRHYTPALAEAAWRCAEGVAAAVSAGEFWPPREMKGRDAEWDDFAPLFQRGAAESVAWEATAGGGA